MYRLIISCLTLATLNVATLSTSNALDLFAPLSDVYDVDSRASNLGIRRQGVGRMAPDLLSDIFEGAGNGSRVSQISLPMLDGSQAILQLRHQPFEGGEGIRVLGGQLDGKSQNLVTLVEDNGVLAGRIWRDGKLYRINGDQRGRYQLSEIRKTDIPRGKALEHEASSRQEDAQAARRRQGPPPRPGEPVDLLIYVAKRAMAELGGRDKATLEMNLLVAEANNIFRQSGIVSGPMFRLINVRTLGLEEHTDSRADLQYWKNFKSIINTRDELGADLVSFITSPEKPRICGTAFRGPEERDPDGTPELGYSLSLLKCSYSKLTFAHHLGYNMGAGHERYYEDQKGHSFGYTNLAKRWSTIMDSGYACYEKYDKFCSELPFFSNPQLKFRGDPLGVPQGQKFAADNADTVRQNMAVVAAYLPRGGITVRKGPPDQQKSAGS